MAEVDVSVATACNLAEIRAGCLNRVAVLREEDVAMVVAVKGRLRGRRAAGKE